MSRRDVHDCSIKRHVIHWRALQENAVVGCLSARRIRGVLAAGIEVKQWQLIALTVIVGALILLDGGRRVATSDNHEGPARRAAASHPHKKRGRKPKAKEPPATPPTPEATGSGNAAEE